MTRHDVLWLTERSQHHQQRALDAAPPQFDVTMLGNPTRDQILAHIANADFLISERRGVIDAALMDAAPHLRMILRIGATAHDIDLAAAELRGILVSRRPDFGNQMVAEYCLLMILALLKNLNISRHAAYHKAGLQPASRTDANTFHYNWAKLSKVGGLAGKVVAIVGMGDIGFELARRLIPFQPANVLYHKRKPLPPQAEAIFQISYADLTTCYQTADVLICLLPYSPATDHLVDASAFRTMKQGTILVQAGSGSTLDEIALADALRSGHLGGAALDTFEYEPLQADHPLLALAKDPVYNVILTPHIAASTQSALTDRRREYDELLRFVHSEPLQYLIG